MLSNNRNKNNYTNLQILSLSICILLLGLFNDFPIINPDSAMLRSPSIFMAWVTIFLFILHVISGGKLFKFKFQNEHICLFIFFIWIGMSTITNIYATSNIQSLKVNGLQLIINGVRFYLLVALIILSIITINRNKKQVIYKLSNFFIYSFLLTIPYSVLELLSYVLNNNFSQLLLDYLDIILHARRGVDYLDINRVRGLSFEPSYYGVYLATILPFIISKYLISKSKIYYRLLIFFIIICVIFSQSRTAYVAILIEFIVFFYLKNKYTLQKNYFSNIMIMMSTIVIIIILLSINVDNVVLSTYQSLFDQSVSSNIIRFGAQHAGFLLATNYFFFGVGPGMSGAYVHNYYPDYMFLSEEIDNWITSGLTDLSAPTFGYFSTLAAEVGILGLIFFMIPLTIICKKVLMHIKVTSLDDPKNSIYGIAILTSILGLFLSSFGLNGTTYLGYWILLSLALLYIRKDQP